MNFLPDRAALRQCVMFVYYYPVCISLLRHPCGVLKSQLSAANLLLTQVNMLPELGYSIQRSVMLET